MVFLEDSYNQDIRTDLGLIRCPYVLSQWSVLENHFRYFVALATDEDAVFGVSNADTLEVVVLNGSVESCLNSVNTGDVVVFIAYELVAGTYFRSYTVVVNESTENDNFCANLEVVFAGEFLTLEAVAAEYDEAFGCVGRVSDGVGSVAVLCAELGNFDYIALYVYFVSRGAAADYFESLSYGVGIFECTTFDGFNGLYYLFIAIEVFNAVDLEATV